MRTRQEFPGVTSFTDRHGKLRWRYRANGMTVSLGTDYGGPDFLRRLAAAQKGQRLPVGEAVSRGSYQAPGVDTLAAAIDGWYRSREFTSLGPSTQYTYKKYSDKLKDEHGSKSVVNLRRKHVKSILATKAEYPAAANMMLRVFNFVLDQCVENELIEANPARGIKKYATSGEGFHAWSDDEIQRFQKQHPEGTLADLTLCCMLYLGVARSDAVDLGPHSRHGDRIQYTRQKMKTRQGVLIDVPIHPELLRRLNDREQRGVEFYLQTGYGEKRSPDGLSKVMRKWCDEAGVSLCSSHGLRKASARRLAEAGATPHELMAVFGWKTITEAQRYTETFNRTTSADRAFGRLQEDNT